MPVRLINPADPVFLSDFPFPIARAALLQEMARILQPRFTEQEARSVAAILLEHFAGTAGPLESGEISSPAVRNQLNEGLKALLGGSPIQHLTGLGHFYGRDFKVGPGALIPRGETEELMLWALDHLLKMPADRPLQLLDVGTGTGCIPISLLLEWQEKNRPHKISAQALEPSAEARKWAERNARHFGVALTIHELDVLQAPAGQFQGLDLLISNPPYIPQQEQKSLDVQVREHEPAMALFVPDTEPLLFYERIASLGKSWLKPGGWLLFECHTDYTQAVAEILTHEGYLSVSWRKDIHDRARMAGGQNPA